MDALAREIDWVSQEATMHAIQRFLREKYNDYNLKNEQNRNDDGRHAGRNERN